MSRPFDEPACVFTGASYSSSAQAMFTTGQEARLTYICACTRRLAMYYTHDRPRVSIYCRLGAVLPSALPVSLLRGVCHLHRRWVRAPKMAQNGPATAQKAQDGLQLRLRLQAILQSSFQLACRMPPGRPEAAQVATAPPREAPGKPKSQENEVMNRSSCFAF